VRSSGELATCGIFWGVSVSTSRGWDERESQEKAAGVRGRDAGRVVSPVETIAGG
jgi:hypothetical protein